MRAIDDDSASILFNNTLTTVNSKKAEQLLLKLVGSSLVFKIKRNRDGSTQYNARLVIAGYEQTDFGETYAPVKKLSTFQYFISLVERCGWYIDHMVVVAAFLSPGVDHDDVYVVLPGGWPESLDAHGPPLIVRLSKVLGGQTQAPRLSHTDINTFLPFLWFTQLHADHNVYFCCDGIFIL